MSLEISKLQREKDSQESQKSEMEYKVAQLQSQNKELLDQIENLSDSAKKV